MGQEHSINKHQRGFVKDGAFHFNKRDEGMIHFPLAVYHGTDEETANRIMEEGFKPSVGGAYGPGIYTAQTAKEAMSWAALRVDQLHGEGEKNAKPAIVRSIVHGRNPSAPLNEDSAPEATKGDHDVLDISHYKMPYVLVRDTDAIKPHGILSGEQLDEHRPKGEPDLI